MMLLPSLSRWCARIGALAPARVFRVSGDSMGPTVRDGDWVLVDTRAHGLPEPGTLVVVRDPNNKRTLLKRVRSRGEKTFAVGSDNPNGARDSRHFGSLSREHLIGNVVLAPRVWRARA